MRRLLFFMPALLAALLLSTEGAAAQDGTLRGRVTGQDGAALPGVQISVSGTNRGTVTDARGLYLLPGLPAGTYTVRAQSIGYSVGEASVTIPAGGTVVHNFSSSRRHSLERLTVTVGSRARVSAAEELAVPVDIFTRADIIEAVPQMEMGMVLQELSPAVYFPGPRSRTSPRGSGPSSFGGWARTTPWSW
jgi:iron complex outermembrane recepter protein